MTDYDDNDLLDMLIIRTFEMTLLDLFSTGRISGTTHTCLGQEYIPVALKPLLTEHDFIISTHRGHGHFIAFTGEITGLLCEITGKEGAVCGGIGGSQHLLHNNIMTTGIQGEGVSLGLGIAWTYQHEHTPDICFVFVGDGTFGRGSVYESLNMACLYKLPYVLIVENNGIAMTTAIHENMSGTIEARVTAFGADYLAITGDIPRDIRERIAPAIARVRAGNGPLVIEFMTSRIAPHSKGDDTRPAEVLEELRRGYWYTRLKQAHDEQCIRLEAEAQHTIATIVQTVLNRKELTHADN